jgi:hypothetical protein
MYRLGKLPAVKGAIKFKADDFIDWSRLPQPPDADSFGHYGLGPGLDWTSSDGDPNMANADAGCCVFTGITRRFMAWTHHAGAGEPDRFSDKNILDAYSKCTGYDGTEATDRGTNMAAGLEYTRKYGIVDSNNKVHRISAFLEIGVGDYQKLRHAIFIFGAADIGIRFPKFAWDQLYANRPWDWIGQTSVKWQGGHYIPGLGVNSAHQIAAPSWDHFQGMTKSFIENCCDECAVAISKDQLDARGYSADGIDWAGLNDYLAHFPT